jgi:prephenate dehydrogenase
MFKKVLIVGLGLIGGSFAKALRKHNLAEKIFAIDPDFVSLDLAKKMGVVDDGFEEINLLFSDLETFDFIVIASPISTYEELFSELVIRASKQSLVIDLGSIKDIAFEEKLPQNFVLCHPIAGLETSGFESAIDNLFEGKKFIICRENSAENFVKKAATVAEKIGSKVDLSLAATKHDEVYALMSHLPQFLSFLTVEFSPKKSDEGFFKTAFRLDESSPEIWEGEDGIFALNEENIEEFYLDFFDNLTDLGEKFAAKKFSEILNLAALEQKKFGKKTDKSFDEKFLSENFSAIFFRFLVVISYLKISQVEKLLNYAGSGFRDFSSIIEIADFDNKKLQNLLQKNQREIQKMIYSITA